MQKTTKSTIQTHLTRNAITPKLYQNPLSLMLGLCCICNIQWLWNSSYRDLANQYVKYLKTKHKNYDIHVVFDGYNDPLSIKAHEKLRSGAISSADININASMQVTCTRESVL